MQTSNHDAVVLDATTVEIACAYSLTVLSTTSHLATSTQQYQKIVGGES